MKTKKEEPKVIVSAILVRGEGPRMKIFLQTRWKPKKSPRYSGMIEIPAGNIEPYENVYDALRREVKEECGLGIKGIIDDFHSPIRKPRRGDKAFAFRPFICQQVLQTNDGLPWIGFVFLCQAKPGKAKSDSREARDPRWVSIVELQKLVQHHADLIFPLQLPALEYFLKSYRRSGH
jgi:8-oxo-dGTP diphosphatase